MRVRLYLYVSFFLAVEGTLHIPNQYILHEGLQSVNGSGQNGRCPDIRDCMSVREGCICRDNLATGVLIDGVVPTIDPVSDMNWASGLFTVKSNGHNAIAIGFKFRTKLRLKRVELNFFNCPAWNIGATTITVYTDSTLSEFNRNHATEIGSIDVGNNQSCSKLTTVSIPVTTDFTQQDVYHIRFTTPSTKWVHIAEAQFSNEDSITEPPQTTSVVTCTCESTTLGDWTTEKDSTSIFNVILIILVTAFSLGCLFLSIALVVVSARLHVYYKKSTETAVATKTTTEAGYDDVQDVDNSHYSIADMDKYRYSIVMKQNEAYNSLRNSKNPGVNTYLKVIG